MTDIVERLRQYEIGNLALQETWVSEMSEAADEIEGLRGENKRLQGIIEFMDAASKQSARR